MAFRQTNLSELNRRLNTVSIDGNAKDGSLVKRVNASKAPAVKDPAVRNSSRTTTAPTNPTSATTSIPTSSLTNKWFAEVEQTNPTATTTRHGSAATLESLGPLRRNTTRPHLPNNRVVTLKEPPKLAYSAVARHGLPQLSDLPTTAYTTTTTRRVQNDEYKHDAKVSSETRDYVALIRRCANDKDAGKAEELLREMILAFYDGVGQAPEGKLYNVVLHAYAVQGNPERAEAVLNLMWEDFERGNRQARPNARHMTSVMYAWQKNKNATYYAPEAGEKVLRQMYRLYDTGANPDCKPDNFSFTCILHCWADSRRKDAVPRASTLFREMLARCKQGEQDLLPDNVAYSNLINVYIYAAEDSGDFGMIEKASEVFWEMVFSFFNGNAKAAPSTRNWNTILSALSKANSNKAAEMAQSMVTKWERLFAEGHLGTAKPDSYSYSLLLKTLASSPRDDAMVMLDETLVRLRHVGCELQSAARLNAIKYGTIIMSLTKTGRVYEAHDMFLDMCSAWQQGGRCGTKPDVKIFYAVISAWKRSGDANKRNKIGILRKEWKKIFGTMPPN